MIHNLVCFHGFIGGVGCSSINSCQFLIDSDSFASALKNIVDVKHKDDLPLCSSSLEELWRCHLSTVAEQVAKDQAHTFIKLFIWLVLDVLVRIQTSWKTALDHVGKSLTGSEHQMVH